MSSLLKNALMDALGRRLDGRGFELRRGDQLFERKTVRGADFVKVMFAAGGGQVDVDLRFSVRLDAVEDNLEYGQWGQKAKRSATLGASDTMLSGKTGSFRTVFDQGSAEAIAVECYEAVVKRGEPFFAEMAADQMVLAALSGDDGWRLSPIEAHRAQTVALLAFELHGFEAAKAASMPLRARLDSLGGSGTQELDRLLARLAKQACQ